MEQSIQTDRVADYLAELRPYLDDLDPSERAEVLDELADALREVAAEDDRPLREVLGPPADYVAAYRASAGLERREPQPSGRLRTLPETSATPRGRNRGGHTSSRWPVCSAQGGGPCVARCWPCCSAVPWESSGRLRSCHSSACSASPAPSLHPWRSAAASN